MKAQKRNFPGVLALLLPILLFSGAVQAEKLTTQHYVVVVTENCEGDVACQDVSYVGTNRMNGKTIRLKGRTLVAMCADGVTPCHHIGYEFQHGNTTYFVAEQGWLEVSRGHKVLLHESGTWGDSN